jgi:hypothetical protein
MATSAEFEVNPIGISFDPERMVAAWRDGADHAELHRRSYAGEFDPGSQVDLRMPPDPKPAG